MRIVLLEVEKIWKKRSFLGIICFLLVVQVFLLWYTGAYNEESVSLSSYKKLEKVLAPLSEQEKLALIDQQYEIIQGVAFVEEIILYQSSESEMSAAIAKQELNANPGVFEKYHDLYESGEYLNYTDSLEKEKELLSEVYKEIHTVSAYSEYLDSVQNNRDALNQISIFASNTQNGFSGKNIEKSADDHMGLEGIEICYTPSKGVQEMIGFGEADILLVLLVALFAIHLVWEEKEKGLFAITRASRLGRLPHICAKIGALFLNCIFFTVVIYGIRFLWFSGQAGMGNLFRSIQSVEPFMESSLQINLLEALLLMVVTKALVFFVLGVLLLTFALCTRQIWLPWMIGCVCITGNVLLYTAIPEQSAAVPLKYLNLFGILQTDKLYGGYLNLNLFGYPVSRISASMTALFMYLLVGIGGMIFYFLKFFQIKPVQKRERHFSRHLRYGGFIYHESYKMMIMNKGLVVILALLLFASWNFMTTHYSMTPAENYYQTIMLRLEGDITKEKAELIQSEQQRFDEAFTQIAQIEELVAAGAIDEFSAESMKMPYESVVMFYPVFQKVLHQYRMLVQEGTPFCYDTGFRHLFGLMDAKETQLQEILFFSLGLLLAFGSVISSEKEKNAWKLLSTTATGKAEIMKVKLRISVLCSVGISLILWFVRMISILRVYPMSGLLAPIKCLPEYQELSVLGQIPMVVWIIFIVATQIFVYAVVVHVVLFFSEKMSQTLVVYAAGAFVLLLPVILAMMGIPNMEWCSVYPLYRMPSLVVETHGGLIFWGYVLFFSAAVFIFRMQPGCLQKNWMRHIRRR